MITLAGQGQGFSRRVATVLSTKIVAFVLAFAGGIVASLLLGTTGKGEYVATIAVPGLLGTVGLLGLPSAINYASARGTSMRGLLGAGLLFTAIMSAVLIPAVWLALPWLHNNFLRDAPEEMVRWILLAVPAALLSSFVMAIMYGRQKVKVYSAIVIAQAIATFALLVAFLVIFRWSVGGAVTASIVVTWALALADVAAVLYLSRNAPGGTPVSYRALLSYGTRFYPASVTGLFNYRVDTYIIQALILQASALGLYAQAVTIAELIFYIPDSVTMVFLPRVAGSTKEQADAVLPHVARLTVLITILCALAVIPTAWIGLNLVLPSFVPCFPALLVLLPAVVSMSLYKVMVSYIAGRARPGPVSATSALALVVNIAANFVLIPIFGIVGAALASLISYSLMAAISLTIACRLSGVAPWTLVVPGRAEVAILWQGLRSLATRTVRAAGSRRSGRGDSGTTSAEELP